MTAYSIIMLEFLPQNLKEGLSHVNLRYVYEIRMRVDKPVTVNYNGSYCYLSAYGITKDRLKAIFPTVEEVSDCVYRAGDYSVYAVEEQLKRGFITAANGERIGIAGEYVFEKGQPWALRSFNALCIRVPHEIVGAGDEIFLRCMSDKVYNLLLISSPGLGKTTILRDLARILSEKAHKNILICDERGELSHGTLGDHCDVIKYSDKPTAFEAGIRALRPDLIVTDEITDRDLEGLKKALFAGVNIVASAHFSSIQLLPTEFLRFFDRIVLLDELRIGGIKAIYNKKGEEL